MANVICKSGLRANYDAITRDALTFYRVQETDGKINLYLGDLCTHPALISLHI